MTARGVSDDAEPVGQDDLADDRSAGQLDDLLDKPELRQRYYGLLQELRVLLPGVQLLLAFLLTVPFDSGFERLDPIGRTAYGVAICSAMTATVCFISPTAFHRLAGRQERSARLVWAIRCLLMGLLFLAVALVAALMCVTRLVYGHLFGTVAAVVLTATILTLWIVIPWSHRDHPSGGPDG